MPCPTTHKTVRPEGAPALRCIAICGLLTAASSGACTQEAAPPQWRPLAEATLHAEQTREHWAKEWGRWAYAQTDCTFVDQDADGQQCAAFQPDDAPAFFFAGGVPGTERTRCVVPQGKALVVPLAVFMADNAGVPESDRLSAEELRAISEEVHSSMTDLQLIVDGVEYEDLDQYAVAPTAFSYELPAEPNWYSCNDVPGVTGVIEPAFITGYFVVLPPPEPGTHEIEYGGVSYLGNAADSSHVISVFSVAPD